MSSTTAPRGMIPPRAHKPCAYVELADFDPVINRLAGFARNKENVSARAFKIAREGESNLVTLRSKEDPCAQDWLRQDGQVLAQGFTMLRSTPAEAPKPLEIEMDMFTQGNQKALHSA